MTRPEVLREQTIQGSYATTDLLQAFDLTLQQGTYEPSTLAPIARLFSAGDVVLQSNLAYWRYNTPRPQQTWALFNPPPAGIGKPVSFGRTVANIAPSRFALLDEEALALSPGAPWPPPLAVFPVSHPRPHLPGRTGGRASNHRRQRQRRRGRRGSRASRRQPDDLLRRIARRQRQAATRSRRPRRPAGPDRLQPQNPRTLVERQRQHRGDPSGRQRADRRGPDLGRVAGLRPPQPGRRERRRLPGRPLRRGFWLMATR